MTHSSPVLLLTLAYLIAGQARASEAQSAADEQAIRDVIQAHATAWNHRDATAAAAVYARDAVVRTSSGRLLTGRAAIEQAHHEWLAEDTVGGGSIHSHPPETIKIQFLSSGIAVADVEGCLAPRPSGSATQTAPDCAPLFIVVVKRGGQWLVAEQRSLARVRG